MRRGNLQLVVLGVILVAIVMGGCGQDKSGRIIDPSGEVPQPKIGVFKGKLDFGQPGPGLPKGLILMARITEPICETNFNKIEVIGTHSGWAEGTSPTLTYMGACVWTDTLTIPQGDWAWKFRTNDDWEGTADYTATGNNTEDGLENTLGINQGDLTAVVSAEEAGLNVGTLIEHTEPARYSFVKFEDAPATITSADDGSFEIRELETGTYNALIRTPDGFTTKLEGIQITGAPVEVTISLVGAVRGTIRYEDAPASPPATTIRVREKGSIQVVASVTATSDFAIGGLNTGIYELDFHSPKEYFDPVQEITFTKGEDLEIGEVAIAPIIGCTPEFDRIQMIGDFNDVNWSPGSAPWMRQVEPCVWEVVIPELTPPGDGDIFLFKLLTDGNWGDPKDFGGSESVTLPIPGELELLEIEGGTDNAVKVERTQPGDYSFRLNLTSRPAILTALPVGSVIQGIQGTLEFQGAPRVPWVPARILVYDGGRQVASTLSDSTGKFQVRGLAPDTYTVVVSAICFQQTSQIVTVGEGAFPRLTFTLQPGSSPHSSLAVAGSFNGYSTFESMTEILDCIWFYETPAPLSPGIHDFAFVTNGFFSFPPDYGSLRDTVLMLPPGERIEEPADLVDQPGATIRFQADLAEPYRFIFNERTQYFTLSPVSVPAPGGVTGIVTFESIPSAPFPAASVTAYQGAIGVATTSSDTVSGQFTFQGLAPGTYRIVASAGCFSNAEVSGVQIGIELVDLGKGSLHLGAGPSAFTSISVAGDFNGFATDALMTNPTGCIWFYDTPDSIEAGTHLFKFVTNGVLDTPPDYGGDESVTFPVPGEGVVEVVTGAGTNIKIDVPEKRIYRFVLDERQRQFQVIAR